LIIESDEDGSASEYDGHDEEEKTKRSKGASSSKISSRKRLSKGSTSQSSDYEEEEIPKKSKGASSSRASSRKRLSKGSTSQSSDYEESSAEEADSDEEQSAVSSDDGSVSSSKKLKPKVKAKSKAQVKSTSRKALALSSSDDTEGDEMDVDDPPPQAKQKPTKRKAVDENERPAKKQKRVDSDPWKLESKPVQRDWTQMKAPPLEMFHFSRKVVDEYTYLDGKIHSLVTRIAAERHWVLSGTPPIHDFGALKTIAAFLNLHLGVDDDAEGQSAEVKKRRREQTGRLLTHHSRAF
jgi:hypothetical protein